MNSLPKRLIAFVKSLPWRRNPALRFCRNLKVVRPKQFYVDCTNSLRCSLICEDSSVNIERSVAIEGGTEIIVSDGGAVLIGIGVKIGTKSKLHVSRNSIVIGENSTFHSSISLLGSISIGRDCVFAPNVTILTGTHVARDRRPIRVQDEQYVREHGVSPDSPVSIGSDVWVGINSVILPGVTLGDGCVVGAGSVVTHSFADYSVVGGVPAKLIRYR